MGYRPPKFSGHPAIAIIAIATVVIYVTGAAQETAFGDFSTLAGYAFTLLYLLVSLAAIGWVVIQAARSIGLVAAGSSALRQSEWSSTTRSRRSPRTWRASR